MPSYSVHADSRDVLLVYNDAEKMEVISSLIKACGMKPVEVERSKYSCEMLSNYEYVVLQDEKPLNEALKAGKKVVCLGEGFKVMPGIETKTITRSVHASLGVYNNSQSIVLLNGITYISEYIGTPVGTLRLEGEEYPLGIMTDKIMYAPYFCMEDISVFAAGQMLNKCFGKRDGGKMYVMIDEVYPFENPDMLELTAEKLYESGIPFMLTVMPLYENTDYPSFTRFCNALKYARSRSGSLLMHDPIVKDYDTDGEDLETKLSKAFGAYDANGVDVKEQTFFPYEVSGKMLAGIKPENELFISLPIASVIRFGVFEDEEELDSAIETLNSKWLQIGDYGASLANDAYIYEETAVDEEYVYRPEEEKSFEFIMNAGNRGLIIIVVFSSVIILILLLIGVRIYRSKFLKNRNR